MINSEEDRPLTNYQKQYFDLFQQLVYSFPAILILIIQGGSPLNFVLLQVIAIRMGLSIRIFMEIFWSQPQKVAL